MRKLSEFVAVGVREVVPLAAPGIGGPTYSWHLVVGNHHLGGSPPAFVTRMVSIAPDEEAPYP